MYLSKLENVFVQIAKCICVWCIPPSGEDVVAEEDGADEEDGSEHYDPTHKSDLKNVFVQILKFICPNPKIYLSKILTVFVM